MNDGSGVDVTDMPEATPPRPHPRAIGWLGTTALAMGGSNQSLFLIGALIAGQGSAAIPLLALGLLLSWAAAFGWTELILMWPNRVGGIAATCAEAFRPYSPVLATLTGVCYWWGWVPTCGLTAILSATAIHEWYLPNAPIPALATALILVFTAVNLCGIRWVTRLAIPIATASALLAALSALIPTLTGHVAWRRALTYHLTVPFHGPFGGLTGAMAGLYLIGFGAPAFEAAACHVGETVDPLRNVPRAMLASALMALLYFVVLPVVWLGALGAGPLGGNLQQTLGPTFAPLLGSAARGAAIWFMMFNMFHGTLQPLAGAARTLMQLADDGLLPRLLALRTRADAPWIATALTAVMADIFLLTGDPPWVIAAANLSYLIGIALPSVAVWLLRRDAPGMARPYRAPRGTVGLGLAAAAVWAVSAILGFEQYGLPAVLAGLALAYSGAALYALRRWGDRRGRGTVAPSWLRSLHLKLTGALLLVLALDGGGYLLAVSSVSRAHTARIAALEDIFVAVAVLTLSVGIVLPGIIAHAAGQVARAADGLATGALADLARAMDALSTGDLDGAHARVDITPIAVHTRDEVGDMARSFNTMQDEVARIAVALDGAREGLRQARDALLESNEALCAAYAAQGEDLAQRVTELDWLRDISRRINTVHSLDEVLDVVYDGIREGLGYDRVGIQLLDRDRGVYQQRRGTDAQGRRTYPTDRISSLADDSPLWRSPGIAAVLRGAEFSYLADALAETPPDQRHLLDGTPTHNLTVPLRVGALVTGTISVDNLLSGRPITPADAGPLLALANQVGTAVENARLLDRERGQRAAAEEALRVRDAFLLAASHDLRTPLTSIVGRTDLMHRRLQRAVAEQADPTDGTGQEAWLQAQVRAMRGAAHRMLATVEEITDAAHLQMGQTLALHTTDVDLGALVEAMSGSVTDAWARSSSAPLVVDAAPGVVVRGDQSRLERVVQNIVENALKYSPQGAPVHVIVRKCDGWATITVRDRGVGIPADELPHIFTHFYRASTALGSPGTGIGLAGSKTIVEQHGGRITVDSVVGQGATVVIALPEGAPIEPAEASAGSA